MCGRFAFFQEIEPLIDDLDAIDLTGGAVHTRFNIPPTTPIYVVTEAVERDSGELVRGLRTARWGLLPHFAKDESMGVRTFNARSETLAEKPSFKPFLQKYRAIIPISGYYEWQKLDGGGKQPYFIRMADESSMYLAGLVAWWKGPGAHDGPAASDDGQWLLTATIITKAAEPGHLADIHDRTPVMLTRQGVETWLGIESFESGPEAQAWIASGTDHIPPENVEAYPVDSAVGNVKNQGPELIQPTP